MLKAERVGYILERLQVLAKRSFVFGQNRVPFGSVSAMQEYRSRAADFLVGGLDSMEAVPWLSLSEHLFRRYPKLPDERLLLLANLYGATYGIVTSEQLERLPSLYEADGWRVVRFGP